MFGLLRDVFVGLLLLGLLAAMPWLSEQIHQQQSASDQPETVIVPLREPYFDFALSRSNEQFAAVGLQGRVTIGRLDHPSVDFELDLPERHVLSLQFSPQESSLLLGCLDGTVLWQPLEPLQEPRTLMVCRESVTAISVSPDGRFAAIASSTFENQPAEISVTEIKSAVMRYQIPTNGLIVWLSFTPDGKELLCRDTNGSVLFLNAATGKLLKKINILKLGTGPVALSSNGRWLAVGGMWGDVVLISANDRRIKAQWPMSALPITSLNFSPDGSLLACGTEDRLMLVQRRNHSLVSEQLGGVNRLHFTARGKKLITSSHDGTIRRWSVPNLHEEQRIVSGSL